MQHNLFRPPDFPLLLPCLPLLQPCLSLLTPGLPLLHLLPPGHLHHKWMAPTPRANSPSLKLFLVWYLIVIKGITNTFGKWLPFKLFWDIEFCWIIWAIVPFAWQLFDKIWSSIEQFEHLPCDREGIRMLASKALVSCWDTLEPFGTWEIRCWEGIYFDMWRTLSVYCLGAPQENSS